MTNQVILPTVSAHDDRELDVVWWLTRVIAIVVVAAGLLMPEFYAWTGADQSRPAPVVGWIALGILIADGLVFILLVRLHYTHVVKAPVRFKRWRFSLFHILVATTIVAIFLMLARSTSMQITCWALQVAVACWGIWVAVKFHWTRAWIAWIAILQFAPLLWVFRHASILGPSPELLAIFTGLPSLVPVAFIVPVNRESLQWLTTFLTTAEFATCVWLSYLGSKRALTGGIVVATLALFSSFVFHALVRM
ncbi:MAG: hypothetical protein SFV81_24325 [Pirellulaceae bacterium]|nr:hypothetical protein [Pirellulaceae bacterium]